MNPIATLLQARRTPAIAARPPVLRSTADADDGMTAAGCGWYDSSNDLRVGLVVSEHDTVDPLSADLPLADWIDLRLQGWRG